MSFKYLDPTGVGYFWYKVKSLVSTKYTKPDAGIPKSDLESSVQTTLTNADTVVTNFSNKIDKVNGATAGNIAILNATGSITDGNTSIQNVELNIDTNGHAYVDLGLPSGTLWATCNVGATNPEDYGDYYAWGETQTKQEYSWNTYQHGSSNSNITKYNVTDGKTELEPDDDVCHIIMGGDWRMPTEVQCRELIANTTYTWTTTNGVTGILLTSTVNNNTLFIPASGYINNTSITDLTIQSCIWSSNLYIHETYGIMGVSELSYRETSSLIVINNDRCKGYPCRGIINKSGIQFKQDKTVMPVKTTASAVEFPDGETALSKVSDLEENKVDKVSGKSLSTNDYTTEDKTKLSNIASGAQVNVLETVKVNDNPLTITNKSVNIDLSNYAQKDGSYSGMTVGAAEDLVSAESVASEFTSRITGGSTAVGKGGTALVDKIKGRTLVWNQLVQGVSGVTMSYDSTTHIYYASGTRTYAEAGVESSSIVAGHIYCGKAIVKKDTDSKLKSILVQAGGGSKRGLLFSGINGTGTYLAYEQSSNSGDLRVLAVFGSSSTTFDVEFSLNVFDLTVMFGAGNEPSTVAEFEALYPGPYYDYNPGTLISNAASGVETVGFNQWDEEWENGSWTLDGTKYSRNDAIRCKNLIKVFPNTGYYISKFVSYLIFFDGTGKVLASSTAIPNKQAGAFTTPSGANYVVFYIAGVTTYQNDICISLSDPSRNGTYEPHWRSELELGLGDIKVKSHNIWDEEWENGYIVPTSGEAVADATRIRMKNYIPVLPNTTYYGLSSNPFWKVYYDANKNYISYGSSSNGTFTTPANAAFIRCGFEAYYGSTYKYDTIINLSDPAFNGRYEPYGDGGVISITGGLKSAGTVYDEISGGKLVKRIESVDLGSMTWSYNSSYGFYANGPAGIETVSSTSTVRAVTPRYTVSTFTDVAGHTGNMKIAVGGYPSGTTVIVNDDSYTVAATFTTAVTGVPLYYKLAQPIEYELAEAIPTAMRNDPYGTERRLPEDTAAIVTAPFRADITYSTNIKEAVQSLPQNFINVNSMQDFLAALGTLMGGTWTMRPADGKFTFTFTENEQPVL